MRFKEFIAEDAPPPTGPTSKSITLDRAVKWAKTMAPNVMTKVTIGKFNLYRGVMNSRGDYQLGNTEWFKRVSKNTMNYYTKFISTSPRWKDYPSRESAYVCTNRQGIAEGYGTVFLVIPADDAKLGIIDSHDMWKAFPALERTFELPGLNSLNILLVDLMKCTIGKVVPDTDVEELRKVMRGWTLKLLHDIGEGKYPKRARLQSTTEYSIQTAVAVMVEKGFTNFEELLEYCLDPEVNKKFTTKRAMETQVNPTAAKEIWFEGMAIFIRHDHFEEFLNEYNKK